MSEEVTIAQATSEDAQQVLTLLKKLDQQSDTFVVEEDLTQLTPAYESQQLQLIQQSRENLILLAKYEQQAIGLVSVIKNEENDLGEIGVAVLKEFWNQGLGTALVEEAITWGNTFSWLDGLFLTVQERNAAAYHIYQKLGFTEIKRQKMGFRSKNGIPYPTIDMQLRFNLQP
ncbi:GNAT family N-acetyltransferase [Pediococcus cellicola]|uniref:N-acetyltransferase domain-containing protein n=1 Tax=Pediococcus cellicola TaxID=319652 RepID=A0A0R2INK4_9LACO|nr:GNAT family N-acetyltransferase [Pediococcus cellicola]KRN66672.1 hypothetical protein IV80_GL001263 [Pediococcus cellicola]GEL14684.1 N-acetyltransferase [Pediococcus cellicola]